MQLPAQLAAKGWPRTRFVRLLLVLGGLVLGQVILHGPSLCGWKVMLPLDLLASPRYYLPDTAEYAGARPDNLYQMDLVSMIEPYRRFAASELAAGRWPRWMDYQFGGVPFNEPIFSPFSLLQYGFRSPLVLPWVQLLAALVAGGGAYVFFRRVMRVSFWPAAVASWCYPLTGFFVFWQGYPTSMAVYWLPWVLLAVEGTVRGRKRLAPVGLSLVTGLVLVSGHLDVAGQVLLASGIYALWRLMRVRPRTWFLAPGLRAASVLGSAWGLGFLLAMPYLLPLLDHTQTSARLERRQAGYEERPPGSLAALPQVVLPDMYGAYGPQKRGTYRFVADNQMESSAATYAGVLATLVLAPLAWCRRRGRAEAWFWLGLSVFGLGWCLDLPGIVQVLRLPGLNLLSHNRFVFIAAFGLLSLSAVGLEVVRRGVGPWRRWFWLPVGVLALLATWCGYRAVFLPEPIASQLGQAISAGQPMGWLRTVTEVSGVRDWFVGSYLQSLLLCGLGLAAWGLLRREDAVRNRGWMLGGLAVVMLGDLIWFAHGRTAQADPRLYYPRLPVLEEIARGTPGRIIGYGCLPANLAGAVGLQDVRGYDGVDPARMVELLMAGAGEGSPSVNYGVTQFLVPQAEPTPDGGTRLSPIMDLLGVRYVVFRGQPLAGSRPRFIGPDYWVMENPKALPRAFVPARVEMASDKTNRLELLKARGFDPRQVAYVEELVTLSDGCRGAVSVSSATPTRMVVSAEMETPGLVVLADRWDRGWHALSEGRELPILCVNHALRGVVLPAGRSLIEFHYAPASFTWGMRSCALGSVLLVGWSVRARAGRRLDRQSVHC